MNDLPQRPKSEGGVWGSYCGYLDALEAEVARRVPLSEVPQPGLASRTSSAPPTRLFGRTPMSTDPTKPGHEMVASALIPERPAAPPPPPPPASGARPAAEIWVDRRRKGGQPCVWGTRLPVLTLVRYADACGDAAALEAYPSATAADLAACRAFLAEWKPIDEADDLDISLPSMGNGRRACSDAAVH